MLLMYRPGVACGISAIMIYFLFMCSGQKLSYLSPIMIFEAKVPD